MNEQQGDTAVASPPILPAGPVNLTGPQSKKKTLVIASAVLAFAVLMAIVIPLAIYLSRTPNEETEDVPEIGKLEALLDLEPKILVDGSLQNVGADTLQELVKAAEALSDDKISSLPAEQQNVVRLARLQSQANALATTSPSARLTDKQVVDLYLLHQDSARLQLPPQVTQLIKAQAAKLARVQLQPNGSLKYVRPSTSGSEEGSVGSPAGLPDTIDSDDALKVAAEEESSSFEEAAYVEAASRKKVLERAMAIVLSTGPVSDSDIKFMQDHGALVASSVGSAVELSGISNDMLTAFHRRNQRGDARIKADFTATLSKGASATVDEVKKVARNAWRAQALGLATEHDVAAFLRANSVPKVDLVRLDKLITGDVPYMKVTPADVQLVSQASTNPSVAFRDRLIRRFLRHHSSANAAIAAQLEAILAVPSSNWTPSQLATLRAHAWNVFGLQVHRALNQHANKYADPFTGIARPTLENMVVDLNGRLENMQKNAAFTDADFAALRDAYEQIVVEIENQHASDRFPGFMKRQTVEEYALPMVLSRFDAECSRIDLDPNPNVPVLFKAAQRCVLQGHPRHGQFVGSAVTVDTAKAGSAPEITDSATYVARVRRLIRRARLLMMLVPTDDVCLRFVSMAISNARKTLIGSTAADKVDKTRLALPSTACEPEDVLAAVAHATRPYVVERALSIIHAILDTNSDTIDAQALATIIASVSWLHRLAIDMPEVRTSSWLLLDRLLATPVSVRAYGLNRAVADFGYTARTMQARSEVASLRTRWTQAIAGTKFGKLPNSDDPFGLNAISTESDVEAAIVALLKEDLFSAIKANNDADILTCLETLKRVLALFGMTSKTYSAATTAADAKAAYNASGRIPLNKANKLEGKLRAEVNKPGATLNDCLPLLSELKTLLSAHDAVWSEAKRVFFMSVSEFPLLHDYLYAPTDTVREYYEQVALTQSVAVQYEAEMSEQANINSLFAKLTAALAEVARLGASVPPGLRATTLPAVGASAKVALTGTNGKTLLELPEATYPYRFCLRANCAESDAVDHPSHSSFIDGFYDAAWLNSGHALYTQNPTAHNKNTLFHYFSSLPFSDSFSPIPSTYHFERNLPGCFEQPLPAALLSNLLNVDTHLLALSTDPIHLIIWTIRVQQAFYVVSSPTTIDSLVAAYKRVRKAVRDFPIHNELTNLLYDFLKTPVTRETADDTQRAVPTLLQVAKLFEMADEKDMERDANALPLAPMPGHTFATDFPITLPLGPPNAGQLVHMYDQLMAAMDKFRFRADLYAGTPLAQQAGFDVLYKLQILAALNPDVMLPKMRDWMHANKTDVCGADGRLLKMLKGYSIQNRSTYLYDDLHFLCNIPLDLDDDERPVQHQKYTCTGFVAATSSDDGSCYFKPFNAAELRSDDKPKALRSLENMRPLLEMIQQQWHALTRESRSFNFAGSAGIDAGGLSRDVVASMWAVMAENPKMFAPFTMAGNFLPNLATDPQAAKLLVTAIVFGFHRFVTPAYYFPRFIHDMIFGSQPETETEVRDTYVRLQFSTVLEAGCDATESMSAILAQPEFASHLINWQSNGLYRPLSEPQRIDAKCGASAECLAIYDETSDYRQSLFSRKHLQVFKKTYVYRFRQFIMHMQELMSRSTAFSMIPLLHGKDAEPGAALATPQAFFDFLTPRPLTVESIISILTFSNCYQKFTIERNGVPTDFDFERILMRDNSHMPFPDLVKHWLRTKWGKMPDPLPADFDVQLQNASNDTAKKNLRDMRDKYRDDVRKVNNNLKMFLLMITGASSMPHNKKIVFSCSGNNHQDNYDCRAFFTHTCSLMIEIPPIYSEEEFDTDFTYYLQTTSAVFNRG